MKNVTFSLFTSFFTHVFTLWPCSGLKENAMPEPKLEKQRPENYQNGREPHFFGFQPPQKLVGSLPPSSTRRDSCSVVSTGNRNEP